MIMDNAVPEKLPALRRFVLALKPFGIWGIYGVLFAGHVWVRSLGDDFLPWRDLAAPEKSLFFGQVPSHALQSVGRSSLLDFAGFATHLSWFLVPVLVGLVVTARRRDLLLEYFGWILFTFFTADLFFLLVPVVPPWMDGSASRVLMEQSFINYTGADSNPVASMPSLHAMLPLVIAIFVGRRMGSGRWDAALRVYAFVVGLAVVYLGEHWVLDVIAGYALAFLIARLLSWPAAYGLLEWVPGKPLARLRWLSRNLSGECPQPREPMHAERSRAA